MVLDARVALVTGGSRGIGKATALALAGQGAMVVVNYLSNSQGAEEVVGMIRDAGGEAFAVKADVSNSDQVDEMIKTVVGRYGRLDVLVNNAGVTRDNLIMRLRNDDWDYVLDTNLRGMFYCSRAAIRYMLKNKWGRIVNITSVVGLIGNAGQVNYAAAKAGVVGFTKSLAREVGSRGITVNAVAPGFITTDMTENLSEEARVELLQRIPLGRLGRPEDVAAAVVFLTSEAANYITGHTLVVDGGMAM